MAEYNLLGEKYTNDTFAVTFDVYTPRPHYIILPQKKETVHPEFSLITDEQTQKVIKTAKSALECFNINGGVLSIHRGSWRTTRDKFHAHVCVDVDSYLRVYESRKKLIPNWPSREYVTKQWRHSKNPRSYADNVRGYPYRSYLDDEVASIRTIRKRPTRKENIAENAELDETFSSEDCAKKIVYHSRHPKIGFVCKKLKSIEDHQNLLSAMEKFAQGRNLTSSNSKDENEGCHICLYFGSAESDEWNFSGEEDENVRGHIVTTGFRFYQLCPSNSRDDWFHAFRQSGFKCTT